jgi:hypothetical protein
MQGRLFAVAIGAFLLMPGSSFADTQILCTHPGLADVVITLNGMQRFGRVLDCISGDFISDMQPCAPNGAYGLSSPTGGAGLVGIVDRWQDYMNHLGGITGHFMTADKIYFSGGFNGGRGGSYEEKWSFALSRLTGSAELKEADKNPVSYSCRAKKRLF